jgi:hypothetical protein
LLYSHWRLTTNDDALVTLDETSPLAYLARAEGEVVNPTYIDLSIAPVVKSIAVIVLVLLPTAGLHADELVAAAGESGPKAKVPSRR